MNIPFDAPVPVLTGCKKGIIVDGSCTHPKEIRPVMIDWNNIDTVLLDMDGTLLDLCFDNFFWMEHVPRVYADKHQISAEASSALLQDRFHSGIGTLNWYCLDHWSEQLGLDIPGLKRELKHLVSIRPFALEFLDQLKASDREIIMVTNAHRKTLEIKMEEVDITHCFDRIVVSHDLGFPKEDIGFWQKLQNITPFDPTRTLLVDDTESVLDSAQRYGIAHLLTLLQPDSQRQIRCDTRFPGIHHFDEIMPDEAAEAGVAVNLSERLNGPDNV